MYYCNVWSIHGIWIDMTLINNLTFKTILKTKGRKTGKEHTVWVKAVTYNDMIYFQEEIQIVTG